MLLELLYDALREEFGLVVNTTNPEALRQKLYPLRKEDPALEQLSFHISPLNPTTQLWIIKAQGNGENG